MAQGHDSLVEILSASQSHGLSLIDTTPFLSESFDPQEYANNIIEAPTSTSNGQSSTTSDNWLTQTSRKDLDVEGDVSVALSRLNLAIDDVDRLIRDEVTAHANDLLTHTTTLLALRPSLAILTDSLRALQNHQSKLIQRVSVPRASLIAHTTRLSKMRSAQNLVKRSERFVKLVKRLQGQMKSLSVAEKKTDDRNRLESLEEVEGEGDGADGIAEDDILDTEMGEERGRGLSMAALTLSEIVMLVEPNRKRPPRHTQQIELDTGSEEQNEVMISSLDFVKEMVPFVNESRERVTNLMEDMIVRGLRDLSPTLLSTSLQTAFNLGQLADLVRDLLADLNDVVRDRVAAAFDMQSLSREMGTREPNLHQAGAYSSYRSKRGQAQMDTSMSTPQSQKWNAALWSRLETLIVGEMGAVCSKVYTLERVLSLKTDRMTATNYLEEAMSVLGDRPSTIFWATLSKALEKQSLQWTKSSSFLSQTFANSYPRLVRLIHDFFDKVAIYTETVSYTSSMQSAETLQMLAALSHLQEAYITRSRARLDNFLSSSFSSQRIAGSQEGHTAARLVGEELDRARFDPLLLSSVIQMVQSWLTSLIKLIQEQRIRDSTAYSLQRASTTAAQISNASLTSALFALQGGLHKVSEEGPKECEGSIKGILKEGEQLYSHDLVEPLLHAISKEISDTFAKMHYVDFGLDQDSVLGGSGGSAYMSDLSDRMWYIREQLLVHYTVESDKTAWVLRIAKHALRSFVIHASMIRPLGEGGKLKLTSDMTELEFAISQLLGSAPAPCPSMSDCGSDFKALRSFRALIFREDFTTSSLQELLPLQSGLAVYEVAHHIIIRSQAILLPHELHKWSRIEYLKWLDNHKESLDAMQLIKGCLDSGKADESRTNNDDVWVNCLQEWITLCSGNVEIEK